MPCFVISPSRGGLMVRRFDHRSTGVIGKAFRGCRLLLPGVPVSQATTTSAFNFAAAVTAIWTTRINIFKED